MRQQWEPQKLTDESRGAGAATTCFANKPRARKAVKPAEWIISWVGGFPMLQTCTYIRFRCVPSM